MSRTIRFGLLLSLASFALPLFAQVNVLTFHNDNSRSGQNLNETILNPTNVRSNFGKLFTVTVDDWIVAQPLYVANLNIGGGTHNVIFVATLNNSIYAVDADTPTTVYWQQNFGPPTAFVGICQDTGYQGAAHHGGGIISTPVIDLNLNTIYFVTKTGNGSSGYPYLLTFYAVNIQTGATIASTVINPGAADWNPFIQMSRPGLAEDPTGSFIYVALGATGCKNYSYEHGYVIAYSTTTALPVATFATTFGGHNNGGIWQAGGGLALDVSGNIFFDTADAAYDGKFDFGDSFLQLSSAASGMTLSDWFTPDNQLSLYQNDWDLSSTGPALLPDQVVGPPHIMIGSGKTEEVFVINRDAGSMGKYNTGKNAIVQDIPAPAYMNLCANVNDNTCRSGAVTYFITDSNNDAFVYLVDDGASSPANNTWAGDIVQYTLTGGVLSTTPVRATFGTNAFVGSPSISASGTTNGIVWLIVVKGTATALHALDATTLTPLYNSNGHSGRDTLGLVPRFITPTVVNGKVYVGGKTKTGGSLTVYGLLSKK